MKISSVAAAVLAVAGILYLCFAAGRWYEFTKIKNAPRRIVNQFVERPFQIPAVNQLRSSTSRIDSLNQPRLDSLIARAQRADSLERLVRRMAEAHDATFIDTVMFEDSSASFTLIEEHLIMTTPLDSIIRKATTYSGGTLRTKTQAIETIELQDPTLWEQVDFPVGIVSGVALTLGILALTR